MVSINDYLKDKNITGTFHCGEKAAKAAAQESSKEKTSRKMSDAELKSQLEAREQH